MKNIFDRIIEIQIDMDNITYDRMLFYNKQTLEWKDSDTGLVQKAKTELIENLIRDLDLTKDHISDFLYY